MIYCVYRIYDEPGELLYVGCSWQVRERIWAHRRKSWGARIHHVSVQRYGPRADALAAERTAIRDEAPAFNIMGRVTSPPRRPRPPGPRADISREELRDLLVLAGRSQSWLADQVGVRPNTVHRWVSGNLEIPAAREPRLRELLATTPSTARTEDR